ncbi:hypothetical protein [Paenibacillus cymbidii]|uniref:hypothetical protein n=1 Tax=Paenibacillus cymbidii TaxID=1639034 RepID=UPI00108163B9|nr:hypothetical protein [Paenibacillus cymbidii]
MDNPYRELATLVAKQADGSAERMLAGAAFELGTMTATGVKLDSFKHELRDCFYADYPSRVHLPAYEAIGRTTVPVDADGVPEPDAASSERTLFSFETREIADVRCELRQGLQPGDRVLCAPLNGGHDVVVLCKVVSGHA